MTDSFDGAMTFARKVVDCQDGRPDGCVSAWCEIYDYGSCEKCEHAVLDRLQEAHDHEMDMVDKSSYHRGHEDGQRSMDAEHYAVALRLRHLPLDGGSHENLSAIAGAIWHGDFGWTKGACSVLRDKIIELLGGVHDGTVPVGKPSGAGCADCDCGAGESRRVTYDELGNERHKAVCALRKVPDWYTYDGKQSPAGKFNEALSDAIGVIGLPSFAKIRDRLIHLLGGEAERRIEIELDGASLSQASVDAMSRRAEEKYIEHEDGCLTLRDGLGGEIKLVKGDVIINGESLMESLVKSTEELSRQGKVRFPPNADGSLDGLKTVEETAALIDEVKRRAESDKIGENCETDASDTGESSKCRESCETGRITDELREKIHEKVNQELYVVVEADDLYAIADNIDAQLKRLCEQHEAVLQKTIDEMAEFREHEAEYAAAERDELQAKLDAIRNVIGGD